MIAEEIKDKITTDEYIERIEEKSGYLNFYINNEKLVEEVLKEIEEQKKEYGKSDEGNGKI